MIKTKPIQQNLFVTTVIMIAGLLAAITCGGFVWGREFSFQIAGMSIGTLLILAYLVWRTWHKQCFFIRLKIEWILGVCVLVILLSWFLSPNMRIGLERIGTFLSYIFLFYIFLDALDAGFNRWSVLVALLAISGFYLLTAVAETYFVYKGWYDSTGNLSTPYIYRFTSFMGHANGLMALANLAAPLALTAFLHRKAFFEKVGAGIWLMLYFLAVPFSSSRGGWLGMGAWMGIIFILWFWEQRIWQKYQAWVSSDKRRMGFSIAAGVILFLVLAVGVYGFFTHFATHPSHGANIFGGREVIWGNAIKIWEQSPWVGVGPGRVGLKYIEVAQDVPPYFWALNGHGLFTQVLAEFGGLGLAALLLLLGGSAVLLWKIYLRTPVPAKFWVGAILGSCASWLAHGTFEELLYVPIIVPLVLLIAWAVTASESPLSRLKDLDLRILWIPFMILLMAIGRNLWAYSPMSKALSHPEWTAQHQAEAIDLSLSRDPNNYFYATEAAMAWSEVYSENGDLDAVLRAIYLQRYAISIEPSYSPDWANLAILEWQNGETEYAIQDMKKAVSMTPEEGTFLLNLGNFYEESGKVEEADQYYLQALKLFPDWGDLPFWDTTVIRRQAHTRWKYSTTVSEPAGETNSYWQQAVQAVTAGDYDNASNLLAYARWSGEPQDGVDYAVGMLAEAQGNLQAATTSYEQIYRRTKTADRVFYNMMSHNLQGIFYRKGLDVDLVPGFVRLFKDEGQADALLRLAAIYKDGGRCEDFQDVMIQHSLWVQGGILVQSPEVPACP